MISAKNHLNLAQPKRPLQDLFIEHRCDLIRTAYSITGCHHWAEDVVHDAFVRLLEKPIGSEVEQPLSYLFRIVRNQAIDKFRRLSLEARHNNNTEAAEASVEQISPERIVNDQQTLGRVAKAMQELPERSRIVFEMHRIKGVTQKQIASKFKVSPTLVNFIVRDATAHCGHALK